jgi:hypothetical protein
MRPSLIGVPLEQDGTIEKETSISLRDFTEGEELTEDYNNLPQPKWVFDFDKQTVHLYSRSNSLPNQEPYDRNNQTILN